MALMLAVITFMTLPETKSCKMSYDNGDILEGNCTALQNFHESRVANSLIQPVEYKTLLEEKKPCPLVTCPPQNPCVCPKQKCDTIVATSTSTCPEFSQRDCEFTPQMTQDIKKLRPPSSPVAFQGGYFDCKKDVLLIINRVG